MVHAFYFGARIAVWIVYSVQLLLYFAQLYIDRKQLATVKSLFKANRYFRVWGFIATVASLVLFVDAYGVHDTLSLGVRLFFFLVLMWCCFSGVQVASYHSVIAVLPFFGYDKRQALIRGIRVVFIGYTVADFVAAILLFAVPLRAVSVTSLAVLASSNYPVVFGVHYVNYRLKKHRREMLDSTQASLNLESAQTRKEQWAKIQRTWRNYAVAVTAGQVVLQVVLWSLLVMFARQSGARNDAIQELAVVDDPNELPHIGLLVLPFLLNLISTAFLIRSWIPLNAANWVASTFRSQRNSTADKSSDTGGVVVAGVVVAMSPRGSRSRPTVNSRRGTLTKTASSPSAGSDESNSAHPISRTLSGVSASGSGPPPRKGSLKFEHLRLSSLSSSNALLVGSNGGGVALSPRGTGVALSPRGTSESRPKLATMLTPGLHTPRGSTELSGHTALKVASVSEGIRETEGISGEERLQDRPRPVST